MKVKVYTRDKREYTFSYYDLIKNAGYYFDDSNGFNINDPTTKAIFTKIVYIPWDNVSSVEYLDKDAIKMLHMDYELYRRQEKEAAATGAAKS